ncbi:class I SAM-dependent methyltransferase, partial [Acidobacteriota bacterium]
SNVPRKFKNSKAFKQFLKETDPLMTGSSSPEIKRFLQPKQGMNCLDVGCCANLATKRLDKWPSTYYGVDISPVLIHEMNQFVVESGIKIGGLEIAEMNSLPFSNAFFDIAMVIGVFEYVSMGYAASSLKELYRVLKSEARVVLDLPNLDHPHIETMFQLEKYLERPNIPKSREQFEQYLKPLFSIIEINDEYVMLKYLLIKREL